MTQFGPQHPFKQTTETARAAGKKGAKVSPWKRGALNTPRAHIIRQSETFRRNQCRNNR